MDMEKRPENSAGVIYLRWLVRKLIQMDRERKPQLEYEPDGASSGHGGPSDRLIRSSSWVMVQHAEHEHAPLVHCEDTGEHEIWHLLGAIRIPSPSPSQHSDSGIPAYPGSPIISPHQSLFLQGMGAGYSSISSQGGRVSSVEFHHFNLMPTAGLNGLNTERDSLAEEVEKVKKDTPAWQDEPLKSSLGSLKAVASLSQVDLSESA